MASVYSSWMRSALLYLGTGHALGMLALAWRTYRRHPRPYIAIYVWVWVVYLLSVAVYWLFRWFEWPLRDSKANTCGCGAYALPLHIRQNIGHYMR
jgi:hypothetical protein